MNDIVIYTSIFGNYDSLKEPRDCKFLKKQADFICFTDNKNLKSDFYQIILVNRPLKDPVRCNRYYKLLSHKVLPDYQYSLYIDGNIKLKSFEVQNLIEKYLNVADFATFRHPFRSCLFDEAQWVKGQSIDPDKVVDGQTNKYTKAGFPKNYGLTAGTFLLRRHNKSISKFNEIWWEEYMKGSRRDQLSLDYARWKSGVSHIYMNGIWDNNLIGVRLKHAKPLYRTNKKKLIKNLIPLFIKKVLKYKLDEKYRLEVDRYREFIRVRKLDVGVNFTTNLMGPEIKAPDRNSFLYMYKEIFKDKIYEFIPTSDTPYIIDGGANIGLASIFFGLNYPKADIVAFEADPSIAEICNYNIRSFALSNVKLINKALWNEKKTLQFLSEGSDAGRIDTGDNETINVQTVILSDFINKKVDMLKLDIEGAEVEVMNEIKDKLYLVNNLFVEYHSFVGKEQKLENILSILKVAGFRYILSTPSIKNKTPLKTQINFLGMDFYINIFATKH